MIERATIDKVLERADIVEVIESHGVELTKKGTHYVACCPFHDEKTPSFTVRPQYGSYKCFGCQAHGNAISFLMEHEGLNFVEAVKSLAQKYGIEIEEKDMSPKEEQELRRKEAMWIANDLVAKAYAEQLLKPEHKDAQEYAFGRWGKDYCKEAGIGFCPPGSRLVTSLGISESIAKDLKLINDKGFDFFGGRITIPIVDRQHHVIGFTARLFSYESGPKYMNSCESPVYTKSKSLFGMQVAWKAAFKDSKMYVVEGAPDCMRLQSIGVPNTIAPLGTGFTDEHFQMLKRSVSHLCFMPDADPPRKGEDYGPGIVAVMKNGEAAVKFGFNVSVRQIPVKKEKQDPDTYCTTIGKFNKLREVDFVLWYADLLRKPGMTTEQHAKFVAKIAALIATIKDDTMVEMYVTELAKKKPTKAVWHKAVEKEKKAIAKEQAHAEEEQEADLYKKFGFNMERNRYYSVGDKGYYLWSNFMMEPLFHIKDTINPKRLYILRNEVGREELVEMTMDDLVNLARFRKRTEGLGNFMWMASEKELISLKRYLYEKTETATEITQLGWQQKGFFAFGNGIFFDNTFIPVDDYGIVRLPDANYYLPANSKIYRDDVKLFQFERKFVHLNLSTISLLDYTNQLFLVFGNNGKVGFIFYLATLFRDIVVHESRSFPILNLFGEKGSGKSELGHSLMAFFEIDNIPPNIQNSTLPALNDTVAAVANALVHIDEYKNDLDINKHEFLKGLWDGTGRTRMNMDLDKKKETTSVDSGIILSGQEMPTADIALFSRLIFLSFSKTEFSEEQKKNFIKLRQMRAQGMSHLSLQIISMRSKVESSFPSIYKETLADLTERLKDDVIEDRILMNWLSPLAVFRCLESSLNIDLSYKELFPIVAKGIKEQNAECKKNNELAAFWEMIQFLVSEGELIEHADYRIEYLRSLKTNLVNAEWRETKPVLYIQRTRIFKLYKKFGKVVGDTLLPESSLRYYLEHAKEFLGDKTGVRYVLYRKGLPVMDEIKEGKPIKPKSVVQRSYCFDYNMLRDNFDINIETASDIEETTPENKPSSKQGSFNFYHD